MADPMEYMIEVTEDDVAVAGAFRQKGDLVPATHVSEHVFAHLAANGGNGIRLRRVADLEAEREVQPLSEDERRHRMTAERLAAAEESHELEAVGEDTADDEETERDARPEASNAPDVALPEAEAEQDRQQAKQAASDPRKESPKPIDLRGLNDDEKKAAEQAEAEAEGPRRQGRK